jgi:DNA modification methylase
VPGKCHRLLCGDATSDDDVSRLMAGGRADMLFTDPPYGMNLDTDYSSMQGIGTGNTYAPVTGDEHDYDPAHLFRSFAYCGEMFLWGADYYAERIPDRNAGSWFVWDKMAGGEGANDAYDKMFGSNFELCWSRSRHKRAMVRVLWKGIFGLAAEGTKRRVHPTQKPSELGRWLLERFARPGVIVADLFLGSGMTTVAAEQIARLCYGMEIEPKYVAVCLERLSGMGLTPRLSSDSLAHA